jgi:hypothetical protein
MRNQFTDPTDAEVTANAAAAAARRRRGERGCAALLAALQRYHPEHAPRTAGLEVAP